jgi:hypothetical protein
MVAYVERLDVFVLECHCRVEPDFTASALSVPSFQASLNNLLRHGTPQTPRTNKIIIRYIPSNKIFNPTI